MVIQIWYLTEKGWYENSKPLFSVTKPLYLHEIRKLCVCSKNILVKACNHCPGSYPRHSITWYSSMWYICYMLCAQNQGVVKMYNNLKHATPPPKKNNWLHQTLDAELSSGHCCMSPNHLLSPNCPQDPYSITQPDTGPQYKVQETEVHITPSSERSPALCRLFCSKTQFLPYL